MSANNLNEDLKTIGLALVVIGLILLIVSYCLCLLNKNEEPLQNRYGYFKTTDGMKALNPSIQRAHLPDLHFGVAKNVDGAEGLEGMTSLHDRRTPIKNSNLNAKQQSLMSSVVDRKWDAEGALGTHDPTDNSDVYNIDPLDDYGPNRWGGITLPREIITPDKPLPTIRDIQSHGNDVLTKSDYAPQYGLGRGYVTV